MRAGMDFLIGLNTGGEGPLFVLAEQPAAGRDGATAATLRPSAQKLAPTSKSRSGSAAQPATSKRSPGGRAKPGATAG